MNLEFRTLHADEIDVRVALCKEKGLQLLIYKNSRADMDVLDEVVGPMNWQRVHSRDNANCTVLIYDEDRRQWVGKEDVGTDSNTESEKGRASDSFKRACVNWGIGRELYSAPFIWVRAGDAEIKLEGGRARTNDTFSVASISYDSSRRISALQIRNNKTGRIVYTFGKAVRRAKEDLDSLKTDAVSCSECGKPIPNYVTSKKTRTAAEIIRWTTENLGAPVCMACYLKRNRAACA